MRGLRRFEQVMNDLLIGKAKQRNQNPGFMRGRRSGQLSQVQCKLVPVEPGDKTLGGRKSRRARQFKWVPR